jgi:hypothetical protein
VEPPGDESGNIEHTWGMYNKPTGCSTPAYGAPHKQTNKQYVLRLKTAEKFFYSDCVISRVYYICEAQSTPYLYMFIFLLLL